MIDKDLYDQATPLIQHYFDIKKEHPTGLLLFQVGDFYELFFEDAQTASTFLGITLTKRGTLAGQPIPLCGVPVHTVDHYIAKLVRGGFNVVICDQLEPAQAGTLVKRGVTKVLTPGTLTDSQLLDDKSASYLCSFFPMENQWGLLFGELLTAQLFATAIPASYDKQLDAELSRFFPDEVIIPSNIHAKKFVQFFKQRGYITSHGPVSEPDNNNINNINNNNTVYHDAQQWTHNNFRESSLERLSGEHNTALRLALYNFYGYLKNTQESSLSQFSTIQFYEPDDFLMLDPATQRNLDIVTNSHDGTRSHTLCALMDNASTPMGSRTLKKWLMRPLVNQEAIEHRLDLVTILVKQVGPAQQLQHCLKQFGDLERIVGRIALRRAQIQDYHGLRTALALVPTIYNLLDQLGSVYLLQAIKSSLHSAHFSSLYTLLSQALPETLLDQHIIAPGFNSQLDKLRQLIEQGTIFVLKLEQQEQQRTGINSLKIRSNNVHGYYIEITHTHSSLVPDNYTRVQTLVGRERYTCRELKDLEHDLRTATQTITQIEHEIFDQIKREVAVHVNSLRKCAQGLAHIDGLSSLAHVAYTHNFVRPAFSHNHDIIINKGRHPIIERSLQGNFIPNDTYLTDQESLWIITGPNMGGKSTYLRQVALICLMAQCGSFVPAHSASLPILDRIFTRIGAGDNLAQGKSTFLVEMEETAIICTQATRNSLVILDEVGRGTSTFDGLAIAQAVVEFLYTQVQARCLFATHYHELTQLTQRFDGIQSYYAASKQTPRGIAFLYKIIKGVADGSFGLQVAHLASLPPTIINRATEILEILTDQEQSHNLPQKSTNLLDNNRPQESSVIKGLQERLAIQGAIIDQLNSLNMNELSPKQVFDLVWAIKAGL